MALDGSFLTASDATHRAAGILYKTREGQALFLKRGPGGDYPGYWCFPGGHLEDGETPEVAAIREAVEETGRAPDAAPTFLSRSVSAQELPPKGGAGHGAAEAVSALPADAAPKVVDFSTFLADVEKPFEVVRDSEHVGHAWAPLLEAPEPLHPGCRIAIERLFADELGVARMMARGDLTSPQRYKNVTLWSMRITGTGVAYRRPVFKVDGKGAVVLDAKGAAVVEREEEFPWRDPGLYLTEDFLARCNGLPVIGGHPKKDVLDSKEFGRRVVGTIFLPFIRGVEVWGVAKVWDDEANEEMAGSNLSTSPAVVLSDPNNPSYKFRLEDNSLLLIEGKPSLLDHVAICELGVWDKGGEPAGILNETQKENSMPEDVKVDAAVKEPTSAEIMAAIMGLGSKVEVIGTRMDAFEKKEEAEDKADAEDEDKKKADAEAEEKKKADAEAEDKKKADAVCAEKVAADAMAKADDATKRADAATAENSTLRDRISAIEKALPKDRSDDDHRSMSGAQARADAVAELFGKQAPRFLSGEGNRDYRNRLVRDFQEHSPTWKAVDVGTLADDAFKIAEEAIYADASAAARNAIGVVDGGLRMVPSRTPGGHSMVTFHGRPSSWLNKFGGARRFATSIQPNTNRNREVA